MYKIVFSLLCFLWTGSASAFTCPDFFRFVDFGQTDHDGIVYRGGSFFRAEDFDGTALLHIERTECLDVTDIGKDGHGNPIPVVVSIHYNPDNLPADFAELNVRSLEDATAAAEESAERHRTRLQQPDIETTRGENYLCLTDNTKELFSCQVTSPFAENAALIAYCEEKRCTIPVMAIDQQIAVSAVWSPPDSADNNQTAGAEIADRINKIHTFLSPLISLSP